MKGCPRVRTPHWPGTGVSILAAVGPQLPCELGRTFLGSRDWTSSAVEQAGMLGGSGAAQRPTGGLREHEGHVAAILQLPPVVFSRGALLPRAVPAPSPTPGLLSLLQETESDWWLVTIGMEHPLDRSLGPGGRPGIRGLLSAGRGESPTQGVLCHHPRLPGIPLGCGVTSFVCVGLV